MLRVIDKSDSRVLRDQVTDMLARGPIDAVANDKNLYLAQSLPLDAADRQFQQRSAIGDRWNDDGGLRTHRLSLAWATPPSARTSIGGVVQTTGLGVERVCRHSFLRSMARALQLRAQPNLLA